MHLTHRRGLSVFAALTAALLAGAGGAGTVKPGRTAVKPLPAAFNVEAETIHGIEFPTTVRTLIAKAQPDSCYVAPNDVGNVGAPPCASGARPKVNQGYAWSITSTSGDVWWGTIANPLCQVYGAFLGLTTPVETPSYACEFPGGNPLGDTRPPQIWRYHVSGGAVAEMTPADALVATTAGFRAAGAHNGVVLFAGPRLSPLGGLNMFAFADSSPYTFLGATTVQAAPAVLPGSDFTVYTDIRAMLVVEGELYLGVKYEVRSHITGFPVQRGGKVLRWTGNSGSPFSFQEVGTLDTEAAYLAYHEGRIFVSTWPVRDPLSLDPFPDNTVLAGVWMSPDLGVDGLLDNTDEPNWTRVWRVDDFEPDPLVAATYAGGAIASFDGYLYWGTMHVPFLATMLHLQTYGDFYSTLDSTTTPTAAEAFLAAMVGTYRTATVFRGQNLATSPAIDLVYGNPVLPVATYTTGPPDVTWDFVASNNMGGNPGIWGLAGFGNPFNNYLWSAQVHNGRLWMGTMDYSYLIWDGVQGLLEFMAANNITIDLSSLPQIIQDFLACQQTAPDTSTFVGGDLYYFPGSDRPAFAESWSGVGNFTSYGVRSMTSAPSGLFLGMANPMNLLTDATDDMPEGGWEVIRLVDRPTNTAVGSPVTATLDDGSKVTFCGVDEAGYTVGTWVNTPCCGLFLPVPPNYQPPTQMMLLGTSAALATGNGCGDGFPLHVCMPFHAPGEPRLFQPLITSGPTFVWQDITTGYENGMVCGDVQEGSQVLLNELGYNGYLGIVVQLDQNPAVPAFTWWGLAALAVLVAGFGASLARGRWL